MTPLRFAELTDLLNKIEQRMKLLANKIQGNVPEEERLKGAEVISTQEAFFNLRQVATDLDVQLRRLEECLLDDNAVGSAISAEVRR